MSYLEKIEIILGNRLEYNCDNNKAIADVKTWLCCEWQCGMIPDMTTYTGLLNSVDLIAHELISLL